MHGDVEAQILHIEDNRNGMSTVQHCVKTWALKSENIIYDMLVRDAALKNLCPPGTGAISQLLFVISHDQRCRRAAA